MSLALTMVTKVFGNYHENSKYSVYEITLGAKRAMELVKLFKHMFSGKGYPMKP